MDEQQVLAAAEVVRCAWARTLKLRNQKAEIDREYYACLEAKRAAMEALDLLLRGED